MNPQRIAAIVPLFHCTDDAFCHTTPKTIIEGGNRIKDVTHFASPLADQSRGN